MARLPFYLSLSGLQSSRHWCKGQRVFFSPPAIVWPFFEHPPTQLKALKVLYLTHLASVSVTQQQFMVGTSPLKSVNSHRSTRVQKKKIVKDGFLNQYFIAQCLITSLMYSQEACMMLSSAVSDLQQSTCVPSMHHVRSEWRQLHS